MKIKKIFLIILALFIISLSSVNTLAYGFGYSKNSNHEQPHIGKYLNEIKDTDSYYVGNKKDKIVYLTFDAGYDNGVLDGILNVLKEKDVKSTFFVTGDFLERNSDLLKRIVNENHIIGNHTYNHKNITKISKLELINEISMFENKYTEIIGSNPIKFFRPPEGEFNKESLMTVKELGYKTFFWSIAYVDWNTNKQKGMEYAYNSVMNNIHNGAIILMHTVSKDNLMALPKIIDDLRSNGYIIKNLNEFSL